MASNNSQQKLALLKERQKAYQQIFGKGGPAHRAVLDDLQRFCRGDSTTFHTDPRVHALLEGRREVFLRILDHVTLADEELYRRYEKGARE